MIKLNFKLPILFIFLIFTSLDLLALTLNKMQVNSKQDEPLNAVIDVIYSKGDKASNLKPAIASKENYEANGLSRLSIHSDIKITLEEGASGAKIFLTSNEVVKDPFLDLLIQIDSEKGRVYKEYTVLLEPPSQKKSINEVIEAKSKDDEKVGLKNEGVKEKIEPIKIVQQEASSSEKVKEVKKINKEKKPEKESEPEPKLKTIKSTRGKTLYQIARENKPSGVTTEQMVLAIYQNNPRAFSQDNVNTLIKNKKLKIPPVRYFENHSHLEARKILRDQNVEWKNKTKKIIKSVKPKEAVKLKEISDKSAAKIDQLEKELFETKKKLQKIEKLNIESKNNSIEKLDVQPKKKLDTLKEGAVNESKLTQAPLKIKDDSVFVSSISDIDEKSIEETIIVKDDQKGFKTIHVLLLILFFVLLLGLFVLISRRKKIEKNQTLQSFVNEDNYSEPSVEFPEKVKNENKSAQNSQSSDPIIESENVDKSQENGSDNSKKNYLPIADDD